MGNYIYKGAYADNYAQDIAHFRTKGSKNGVRLWQNPDGSYTEAGRTSKPGGRYNQSLTHRVQSARAYGTGEYAQRKSSQGLVRGGFQSAGDLAAAGRDLKSGKMSVADGFKVYGGTALKGLAIAGGAAALTGAAAYGYYNLQNKLGINYDSMNGLQQLFYNTGDIIDATGQMAKYKGGELLDSAKLALANIGKDPGSWAKAAGQYVAEGAKSAGNAVKNDLSEGLGTIKRWGQDTIGQTGAYNALKNGVGKVGSAITGSGAYNAAKNGLNSAREGISGAIQGAKDNAWARKAADGINQLNLGSQIDNATAFAKNMASSGYTGLRDMAGSAASGIKDAVSGAIQGAKNNAWARKAVDGINQLNLGSQIDNASAFAKNMATGYTGLGDMIGSAASRAKDAVSGAIQGAKDNAWARKAAEGINQLNLGSQIDNATAFARNMATGYTGLGDILGSAASSIKDGVSGAIQGVKDSNFAKQIAGGLNNTNLGTQVQNGIDFARNMATDSYTGLGDILSGYAGAAKNAIGNGLTTLANTGVGQKVSSAVNGVKDGVSGAIQGAKNNAWAQKAAEGINQLNLGSQIDNATAFAKNMATGYTGLGDIIGSGLNTAKNAIANGASTVKDAVGGAIQGARNNNFAQQIASGISNSNLGTQVQNGVDFARNMAASGYSGLGDILSGYGTAAKNAITSGLADVGARIGQTGVGQAVGNAASSAANGIKSGVTNAINTGRGIIDTAKTDAALNGTGTLGMLGGLAGSGASAIKNGITSAASNVKNAGFNRAIANAQNATGTNFGTQNIDASNLLNQIAANSAWEGQTGLQAALSGIGDKFSKGTGNISGYANAVAQTIGNAAGAGKSKIQDLASQITAKLGGNSGVTNGSGTANAWSTYGQYAPQQAINNPTTYGANGAASQIRSTGQGALGKYGSGAQNYVSNADDYAQAAANATNVGDMSEQQLWEWYKMLS